MMRNWTWVGFLAAMLAAGCGDGGGGGGSDGDGGTPDASTDSGGGGGSDYLYVINELVVPDTNAGDCVGLNLDGTSAEVCGQPDCGDGVDNSFAGLLGLIPDAAASVQQGINDGNVLLLLRLKGVNSFTDDDDVTVEVLLGLLPDGTDMPMLGSDGKLAPGQTFDVDERSLSGGTPMASVPARIAGGKLTSDPVDLPLNFSVAGEEVTLVLESTRLVADSVSEDAISMGVLGGAISVSRFVDLLCEYAPEYAALGASFARSSADLEPDDSGNCAKMSAGMGFAAVAAQEGATRTPPMDPPSDGGMGMDGGMLPPECTMGMGG